MKTLIFPHPDVAIKLTKEQAESLGIDPTKDQQHGEIKTFGVWRIPVSFRALCVSAKYITEGYSKCIEKTLYGVRTMSKPRSAGYHLEGYVSIAGKKYSCFTSDQLFEVDGKLISVATIYARKD